MKSQLIPFTLLAHITDLVVNNSCVLTRDAPIDRRSVSADHHILWLDRYSYIWPISCTDRNLMTSTRDDVYDAWGHMLQVNAGVEMLWCFEKQWKIRYMSCMFCMMIWWMDCSFLTADSVRADLTYPPSPLWNGIPSADVSLTAWAGYP